MPSRRLLGLLLGGLLAVSVAAGQPIESVSIAVDGAAVDGVIGYRIEFNRQPFPRTDSRRLDTAYSPDVRKLVLTMTQEGLARIQEWLNSTTEGGTPAPRTVLVTTRNAKNEILTRWELTGVVLTTLSTAAAGEINGITATLEFLFEKMRLVEAKPG